MTKVKIRCEAEARGYFGGPKQCSRGATMFVAGKNICRQHWKCLTDDGKRQDQRERDARQATRLSEWEEARDRALASGMPVWGGGPRLGRR